MNNIAKLLAEAAGIFLDIGCGKNKQPGFVGMDRLELPGVDIVHDWNDYPWPFPNNCVNAAMASHVVEHVNPADGNFIKWMDELWRICKVGANVSLIYPHGYSQGYLQDPTHCNACNEVTPYYFDPRHPLYDVYGPKPWHVLSVNWSPVTSVVAIMEKVEESNE